MPTKNDTAPVILSQVTGDTARARKGDPETSHAAADSISVEGREASEAEVLAILAASRGPVTAASIERQNVERAWRGEAERAWAPSRIRTAIKQLVDDGRVVQDGEGRTPSGRRAAAWRMAASS